MRANAVLLATLSALIFASSWGPSEPSLPTFTDIAASAGIHFQHTSGSPEKNYIFEAKGGGVCLLDYDGDGRLDIYFVNGNTLEDIQRGVSHGNALYRASAEGTYTDVTKEAGVQGRGWGMGCTVGDYDNNGLPDIYVLGVNGNVLYRNDHDGRFTDATEKAGLSGGRWSTSAAFVDYDRDGDLDLYVANNIQLDVRRSPLSFPGPDCNYRGTRVMCGPRGLPGAPDALYRNNGDGTFTDVSVSAGVLEESPHYGLGVAVGAPGVGVAKSVATGEAVAEFGFSATGAKGVGDAFADAPAGGMPVGDSAAEVSGSGCPGPHPPIAANASPAPQSESALRLPIATRVFKPSGPPNAVA